MKAMQRIWVCANEMSERGTSFLKVYNSTKTTLEVKLFLQSATCCLCFYDCMPLIF